MPLQSADNMSNSSHKMKKVKLRDDCVKRWEIMLLLLSSEEKKIDRTRENEIDTINYFYNNERVRKILFHWLEELHMGNAKKISEVHTAQKCDEISNLWKERGNEKFRMACYEESWEFYSNSVLYAHQDGDVFPLALGNRSAALLKMKKFKESLSDIELALTHGFPTDKRHRLLLRQADCHFELQDREKSHEALQQAVAHAASLRLSKSDAAEFERYVKKLEDSLQHTPLLQPDADEPLPSCLNGDNPNFVAASKALELRRSDTAGRYVVAAQELRRGDVIFSEEPYAWVALPSKQPICETCCTITYSPVPCAICSRSVYCSLSCRSRGNPFHRWECVGMQADLFGAIGIAHLAIRVLLITANAGFPPVPCGQPPPTTAEELFAAYSKVDDLNIYRADSPPFYRMFNLVTNFDKMNNFDYIQYALTAVMLTIYLESYTEFFEHLTSRMPYRLTEPQLKTFSAALMLRSLGQLVCNGHATLSLMTFDDDDAKGCTVSEQEVRRATAIYPSAAMMNHSCDPNIINTFHNNRLIIRCGRELHPGAEVLNCYGPHKAREPTAHRRAQLKAQYMFNCNCAACSDGQRKDFVLLFTAYACQSCKGPVVCGGRRAACPQCHAEFQLDRALAAIDHADELLAQADSAGTLEQKCERSQAAFRVKQQVWHRHHTGLRALADRLARYYADLGDFTKSVELIKQNIQSLEYQYGSFSVEVAHELRKLAEVMLTRIIRSPHNPDYRDWCLETHKITKKAVQLLDLNYGCWEPLVKRLKEQEATVAALLASNRAPNDDCIHHNLHYNLKI